MSTPNFQFRRSPVDKERGSRYVSGETTANIQIGAPVTRTGQNAFGEAVVARAAADAPRPVAGAGGLAHRDNLRFDSLATSHMLSSEYGYVAPGKDLQVIFADNVKVAFRNTEDFVMVAGMGATPTVAVGDYLTPSGGDATTGFWKETNTADHAWLVVTDVRNGWVEAEFYRA